MTTSLSRDLMKLWTACRSRQSFNAEQIAFRRKLGDSIDDLKLERNKINHQAEKAQSLYSDLMNGKKSQEEVLIEYQLLFSEYHSL